MEQTKIIQNNKPAVLQYQPGPEVKAFIFKQIQDLEPFLKKTGSLGIFVEKHERQHKDEGSISTFHIRLVASIEDVTIESNGESSNIYEACIQSKRDLQNQLAPFLNATSEGPDRDNLIQSCIQGNHQVH